MGRAGFLFTPRRAPPPVAHTLDQLTAGQQLGVVRILVNRVVLQKNAVTTPAGEAPAINGRTTACSLIGRITQRDKRFHWEQLGALSGSPATGTNGENSKAIRERVYAAAASAGAVTVFPKPGAQAGSTELWLVATCQPAPAHSEVADVAQAATFLTRETTIDSAMPMGRFLQDVGFSRRERHRGVDEWRSQPSGQAFVLSYDHGTGKLIGHGLE